MGARAGRPAAGRPRSRSTTSAPRPRRRARWRRPTARSACSAPGTRASWSSPPRATPWRAAPWWPSTSTGTRSSASRRSGLCDIGVTADLRDPLAALEAVRAAGVAAGRPHGRRGQRRRLRADRDPAHRRRGHGALLLDGDQLLRRRRWPRTGSASSARMLVGSGYSPDRGAYALDLVRRSRPLRQALGLPVEAPRERRCRSPGADALARPRRARPRQPHRRAHLPRGGPRRVPEASAASAATSTSSAAAR